MALVSYDYDSSTSENEDDNQENNTQSSRVILKKNSTQPDIVKPTTNLNDDLKTAEISTETETNLFSNLPSTKKNTNNTTTIEDQIEDFIPKSKPVAKEKQKVKITIPSLKDFESDEDNEPQSKKAKPSSKGSGLLSLLPPVKGSVTTAKSFVPKAVADKNKSKSQSLVPHAVKKKAEAQKAAMLQRIKMQANKPTSSDVESDDDFEMPETFDDEMWQKVCGRTKPKPVKVLEETSTLEKEESYDIAPEPEKPYDGLNNEAFKELVGKNRRPVGNIKLIDINEEEILSEKDLWMTKSLTDPEMGPKKNVENPVDPTRRRKHHITYLAQQAKANEQDLQNAWASSKNNRLMSRAKYGF